MAQGELDYVARRPNRPQLDIEAGDLTSHLLSRFLGQVRRLGIPKHNDSCALKSGLC